MFRRKIVLFRQDRWVIRLVSVALPISSEQVSRVC